VITQIALGKIAVFKVMVWIAHTSIVAEISQR